MPETPAATLPASGDIRDRHAARTVASRDGFRADAIRIPYPERVPGGLFGGDVVFTGHGVATRLSGDDPVVTVRSILRWLDERGHAAWQAEWRGGVLQARPGPG